MEVIHFDGYTSEEKLAIAKGYLWPRQRDRNGLREDEVQIDDVVRRSSPSTPATGVRYLERLLGTVLRKTATRIASTLAGTDEQADTEPKAKAKSKAKAQDAEPTSKACEAPKGKAKGAKATDGAVEIPCEDHPGRSLRDARSGARPSRSTVARTATRVSRRDSPSRAPAGMCCSSRRPP